ncbi:MAG: DNA methyltransferase, partial [Halobacteriaceae archaeon]
QEQDGYDQRLYALEYYCSKCDENGLSRGDYKSYKPVKSEDIQKFEKAKKEWRTRTDLHEYVPNGKIPRGAKTESSSVDGSDVFQHGIEDWVDMYNERQLLSLSKILKEISQIEDQNVKEYLLLALTGCLNRNNMMIGYDAGHNAINNMFKSNSFDPPQTPAENNVWGVKHGTGPFFRKFELIQKAVEYAHAPTDRYVEDGETIETPKFDKPLGEDTTVICDDVRNIDQKSEYDAV